MKTFYMNPFDSAPPSLSDHCDLEFDSFTTYELIEESEKSLKEMVEFPKSDYAPLWKQKFNDLDLPWDNIGKTFHHF